MPFFGYGNFMTARADVGVGLTQHLNVRAGYEMGSRLSIHGTSDQIAVKLAHQGSDGWNRIFVWRIPSKKGQEP